MFLESIGHRIWRLTQVISDWQALRLFWQGYDVDLYLILSRSNLLKKLNVNTIVDIGAYKGKWAYIVNLIRPEADILAFEPLEEQVNLLMRHPYIKKVLPFALGSSAEIRPIHITNKPQSSSLLNLGRDTTQFFPFLTEAETRMIQVEKLDNLLSMDQLKKEALVKIDVQGFELDVINGGQNFIAQSKAVLVEVNYALFYDGQSSFLQICQALNLLGLEYVGALSEYRDPVTGMVLFEDALFVRGNVWNTL